jgi:hypothetical protein
MSFENGNSEHLFQINFEMIDYFGQKTPITPFRVRRYNSKKVSNQTQKFRSKSNFKMLIFLNNIH